MAQHNLRTVVSFEFFRTISKVRFWIGTLSVPLIMAVVFSLDFVSNSSTAAASDAQEKAEFSIAYTDASGLTTADQAVALGAEPAASPEEGIRAVQAGEMDAYFNFPADPATSEVKVYGG